MKRLFILFFNIVFFICLFNRFANAVELPKLPEDFQGNVTRQRIERIATEDNTKTNLGEYGLVYWEIIKYFYDKYPNIQEVDDEVIMDDLQLFFPQLTRQELLDRVTWLNRGIEAYDGIKDLYQKYLELKLAPHSYKAVHSEDDYDHPDEVPYIEPQDGKYFKVYNFKKFLTYSQNKDERNAIRDYQEKKKAEISLVDRIADMFNRLEFKKLFFYGEKYKNPWLSDLGITKFLQQRNYKVRLITPHTYVDKQQEIFIGLQFDTDGNHFIVANDLTPNVRRPIVDLSQSSNVESYQIMYPAPMQAVNLTHIHKYYGNFLIPIKIKVADPQKDVKIRAIVDLTTMGNSGLSFHDVIPLELNIEASGKDYFVNGYDNFFNSALQNIPKHDPLHLYFKNIVVDNDAEGQTVRVEFETDKKISSLAIYLEEKDGYTQFNAPLISIQDNRIYARFIQNNPDQKKNLVDSEFTLTAVLNNTYYYRDTLIAGSASNFDVNTVKLNLGLVLLAIIGGFILNFMPCVFPVLSFKIIALSRAVKQKKKVLRQSLWKTIYGIFAGFSLIILSLLLAKYLGYSLGWGMQFQNMSFLVIMTFILASCIIVLPYIQTDKLHKHLQSKNQYYDFLIGTLIVLLATPCTGPYLATAIGFALTGTYTDIIILLYAVALGLSLPYLLVIYLKDPENLFPKPGKWMDILQAIMKIMLYLTILWFFWLMYNQTDGKCIAKIVILLIIFMGVFWLYNRFNLFLDGLKRSQISTKLKNKYKKNALTFIITVFIIITALAAFIAQRSYQQNYENNIQNRELAIDTALIQEKLRQGHSVLIEIRADWCMTCQVNGALVFTKNKLDDWKNRYNLDFIRVDWTNYNKETLNFMEKHGRKGLPFYILYTPFVREGIVLSEILADSEIENILQNRF